MRPTFLGFETGRKGLSVVQKGLDIVGHNLSNIGTPGYARQRVDQVSVAVTSSGSRYAVNTTHLAGQGTSIKQISQVRDSFLDKRFREEFSDTYYYDQQYSILSDIESVVDEFASTSGISDALNEIFSALQNFSADNADQISCANILCTTFKGMSQVLQESSAKLDKVAEQHKFDLGVSVDYVNDALSELAGLNKEISTDMAINVNNPEYTPPNELMDKRNLILDELSRYGNIDTEEQADGSINVSMNGHPIVSGDEFEAIQYTQRNDGTVALNWQSTGSEIKLSSGSLKGYVELINGRGPNIQSPNETPQRGVLYYKDRLNTFARTIAQKVNNIIPELDANGNVQVDSQGNTVYKQLFGALVQNNDGTFSTSQNVMVTADNISITDEWSKDASYAIFQNGSFAGSDYINQLTNALKVSDGNQFYTNGMCFTGSFTDYIQDVSNTCAADTSFAKGRLQASGAVSDELLNRRDSIMGVAQDEETSNMMMYQRSYQAMSRLMTAMDEALDIIINKMGLVGR